MEHISFLLQLLDLQFTGFQSYSQFSKQYYQSGH